MSDQPDLSFSRWAPVVGRWVLEDAVARYMGPGRNASDEPAVGLVRAPDSFGLVAGEIATTVQFPRDVEKEPQGKIFFGFHPATQQHVAAGLGGYGSLYNVEQWVPGRGYVSLATAGRPDALQRDRPYALRVFLTGQSVALDVDDVIVIDVALPAPLEGSYLGLIGRGRGTVEFTDFATERQLPEAFVVMQFGEPFDTLYAEVIAPVCSESGYVPVRADEFAGPGVIMQDIIAAIQRASVVIAEVTPVNANVFYELGYAQATGKPTILLADRGELTQLPFDISGNRCIFYSDSIGGKTSVEADLRRHLAGLTYAEANDSS